MNPLWSPGGFHPTISAARGEAVADRELEKARASIRSAAPCASPAQIEAFLSSPYGEFAARDVLKGAPMGRQIAERGARFNRHFAEIARKLASASKDPA